MRALQCVRYGPPLEVLRLADVETPAPAEGRVLVKVRAASVNPADWHSMHGGIARLFNGFRRPKDPKVGTDVAGVVEAVGANVTRLKVGDEVFGGTAGSLAEYAVAREDRLARKPANRSFEEAAAVPIAGITALQGLRDRGHVRAGQKVLVNGASGGVGTFAVQIAKAFGAEVTGVCSTRNVETARAIGADRVIDYTKEDFARDGQRYDLIYDIVAHHSISEYKRLLNPGGACYIAGIGFPELSVARFLGYLAAGPARSRFGGKTVRFMGVARINAQDLATMAGFMETGMVVPVIDRRFPLDQAAEAMRYLGEGHARGKIVVTVDGGHAA